MATLFQNLARSLTAIKGVKVQATKAAILVNLPVDRARRQTVKVTAASIRVAGGETVVARLVSRTGFIDNPVLVRKALEFNAGRQRFGLCLATDCDPPALDAVAFFVSGLQASTVPVDPLGNPPHAVIAGRSRSDPGRDFLG